MIQVTAFRWAPPLAQGLVRDLRVRWALEEAGLPYEARLIGLEDRDAPGYRAVQPFGQVPAFEEDGLVLFESGAIVLHLGERSEVLLPKDVQGRARAKTWVLAALNTIEPAIQGLTEIDLFHADEPWAKARRPQALENARKRLGELSRCLEGREYLEDRFTAGDLMMTTVLAIPRHIDLLAEFPTLDAYRLRCEARPAYRRALEAQLAPFGQADAEVELARLAPAG